MKTVSILLALINSLAAGLVIAASLPAIQLLHPAASIWHAARVAVAFSVVATGVLTWIAACRATSQRLIFLAALFLVALGTASAVWTVRGALISGTMKQYIFLYGGSLMARGAACLWCMLSPAITSTGL